MQSERFWSRVHIGWFTTVVGAVVLGLVATAWKWREDTTFDAAAARAFGRVAAGLRAAGRKPKVRAYDALIASVAVATGLPLYTVNPDDFADIADIDVHPIPHPDNRPPLP